MLRNLWIRVLAIYIKVCISPLVKHEKIDRLKTYIQHSLYRKIMRFHNQEIIGSMNTWLTMAKGECSNDSERLKLENIESVYFVTQMKGQWEKRAKMSILKNKRMMEKCYPNI